MKLSIIMPVYNEVHTIDSALAEVLRSLPGVSKEIIIVDDGSTDGTRDWLLRALEHAIPQPVSITHHPAIDAHGELEFAELSPVRAMKVPDPTLPIAIQVIFHPKNKGKGAAVRTGFYAATGDVWVIQDADLEYNPQDWHRMWQLFVEGRADVVYGSRFSGEPHRVLYFHHYLGNQLITWLTNLFCNTMFTDIEVCYKMFRAEVFRDLQLTCNDFGFEVEFTIKVSRSPHRWRLYETGISYYGRTYAEGKKINWKDGFKALWYIFWFRWVR